MPNNDQRSRKDEGLPFRKMIIITTSSKDKKEAEKIVRHLLNKRLIACGEMHSVNSIYRWKGKIEEADEIALVLKTTEKLAEKAEKEIEKIHSYDAPVISTIKSLRVNKKSKSWLRQEL